MEGETNRLIRVREYLFDELYDLNNEIMQTETKLAKLKQRKEEVRAAVTDITAEIKGEKSI